MLFWYIYINIWFDPPDLYSEQIITEQALLNIPRAVTRSIENFLQQKMRPVPAWGLDFILKRWTSSRAAKPT